MPAAEPAAAPCAEGRVAPYLADQLGALEAVQRDAGRGGSAALAERPLGEHSTSRRPSHPSTTAGSPFPGANNCFGAGGQRAGVGDAATNCVLPLGEHSTSHRTSHRASSATAGSSFLGGGPSYGMEVLCFNGVTKAQVYAARGAAAAVRAYGTGAAPSDCMLLTAVASGQGAGA
jgi:hypothetical protein